MQKRNKIDRTWVVNILTSRAIDPSTASTSRENRFRIRPRGVVSKNIIGWCRMVFSILLCSCLDAEIMLIAMVPTKRKVRVAEIKWLAHLTMRRKKRKRKKEGEKTKKKQQHEHPPNNNHQQQTETEQLTWLYKENGDWTTHVVINKENRD